MNKDEWKTVIESQIKADEHYLPSFQTAISILSEILEQRERVFEKYISNGAEPVVVFTSDRGAENLKENPLFRVWKELTTEALAYLNALGLTASGLQKIQGKIPEKPSRSVEDIMSEIRKKSRSAK